jgi:hypothetical protein
MYLVPMRRFMMRARVSSLRIASGLLAATALPAAAHCCHDERMLGIAQQSELRRGTHSLGSRRLGEEDEEQGPSVGRGMNSGSSGLSNGGGVGAMQGTEGLGNYGAGSLGERGPGGLGTLHGDSIHRQGPRPR